MNDAFSKGKEFLNKYVDINGDLTLGELETGNWRNKKKSALIRWLMSKKADLNREKLGELFGSSKGAVDMKMSRDSFSIDELIIAAYAADYEIVLRNNSTGDEKTIDAREWFRNYDKDTFERLKSIHPEPTSAELAAYERKKRELEDLKREYGIKD